jgi:hypothetical protein
MVANVYFYADGKDTADMLGFLRFGSEVSLHPWPLVQEPAVQYSLEEAIVAELVMVQSSKLGRPILLDNGASDSPGRAAVFNLIDRERLNPGPENGLLVDSNRSPVLLWRPGSNATTELRTSTIGSQADSMKAVSDEYQRWANRVMGWMRRQGTAVWGLNGARVRPDLDINVSFLNSVYALPGALRQLEAGASGR